MTANDIVKDARLLKVRELKSALEKAVARAVAAEAELETLTAHFNLALLALRDFEELCQNGRMLVVDGWNAVLKERNVAKLTPEDVKRMRLELLDRIRGQIAEGVYDRAWVVFDGERGSSLAEGPLRVSYTGGSGRHRADRMILDFANCAFLLGLDTSRIMVETSDKGMISRLESFKVAFV